MFIKNADGREYIICFSVFLSDLTMCFQMIFKRMFSLYDGLALGTVPMAPLCQLHLTVAWYGKSVCGKKKTNVTMNILGQEHRLI